MEAKDFCTCNSFKCKRHPQNHSEGCTPCILKNLERGEIPSCFFHKVEGDKHRPNYSFEDFARLVLENK